MRTHSLLLLPAVLLMSACTSLNHLDIRSMDRQAFEAPELRPSFEVNDFRVDLIRQTTSVQVNDSTSTTENTPYHPVGFDLGNGLFYDLNGNLGFRVEALLELTEDNCFNLEKTSRRKQRRPDVIYRLCDGELSYRMSQGGRERYLHQTEYDANSVSVYYRNRLRYALDFKEDAVVYRGKRRKLETIHRISENQYRIKHLFSHDDYRLSDRRLFLNRSYVLELSDDARRIQLTLPGLFGRRLYTIERDRNRIYIYDNRYRGTLIETSPNEIRVYRNRVFVEGWRVDFR